MIDNDHGSEKILLPREPIHRLIKPLHNFLHVEAASGVVLLLCALVALALANSGFAEEFLAFWKIPIGLEVGDFQLVHPLKHWINDALMAVFFFVIGLEVKREIVTGELRDVRRAALPVAAAIGGMVVPAGIYLALQAGQAGQRGWGIPMATDIAFVVGCMALLGRRVPAPLRVILLSIAIADDIGAILVIAIGYTETLDWGWLGVGVVAIGIVVLMQRVGIRSLAMYAFAGILAWLGFHESGIHATIAGVAIGLLTPAHPYLGRGVVGDLLRQAGDAIHGGALEQEQEPEPARPDKIRRLRRLTRETVSPLEYLIYVLHPWVAFLIMPLFALANAGVAFNVADAISPVALAVMAGLVIGKPVGILLLSWLFSKSGLGQLPAGIQWRHMIGGGFLAGIGFTMALFVTGLAFTDETILRSAKVGVLLGSVISGMIGMIILATAAVPPEQHVSAKETP